MIIHKSYPCDVSDAEWQFGVPYLCLLPKGAGQRVHILHDIFDPLRWMVHFGSPGQYLLKDFSPWPMVDKQTRRWIAARCIEVIVHDQRAILLHAEGWSPEPTALVLNSRTIQSTCESGPRAGYDGYKRGKGSEVFIAVDTLGHLLALHITPSDRQDRAQAATLTEAVQQVTSEAVQIGFVDKG